MQHINPHLFTSKKPSLNITQKHYNIFDSNGQRATLETIIDTIDHADVVFLGEMHNDPVAHYLQQYIFEKIFERYFRHANSSKRRQIVLSLEMFERDVQMILDEYLFDIIDEQHFLTCSRPWNNYLSDYHPLVKFSKKNNIRVIAANAPRRYVHRVAQYGQQALNDLSATAKTWIAALPYQNPSDRLKKRFNDFQQKVSAITPVHDKDLLKQSHFLDAQNLWDATMAYSLKEELTNTPKSLILHLNGYFHSQSGLGTPEHLAHYRPGVRMLTITIVQAIDFPKFDPSLKASGDFIVITDPKIR
ncbi:MAG: ChaN family lipoprotein [Candidatus Magnetomorum sp.]|nr:ChaN family lipoprotein [Candidatus Magnetomorum sp.]